LFVLCRAESDSIGKVLGKLVGGYTQLIEAPFQLRQALTLTGEQKLAELTKLSRQINSGFARRHGRFCLRIGR
jgi:hypothetical protein